MARFLIFPLSCFVCLFGAVNAFAQQSDPPPTESQPTQSNTLLDRFKSKQFSLTCEGNHCFLKGQVELPLDAQTTLFADEIEMFGDTNRLVATGNVVFSGAEGRLAAEKLEYDVDKGTGTFYTASGLMSLGDKADRRQFGNQEADVYFVGETIERLGPRKYRLTRGGFTTCVQPTPRWEMTSGSMVLNLNDYATANSTVLRVKGVPVMYLPFIYYPIKSEDRATGFLLPTYGTSTIRGQAISNAFFWAINRSQDATFFHDWFTRSGQGAGTEYRYVASGQSSGNVRFYRFWQRDVQFDQTETTGTTTSTILAPGNSFEIIGGLNHALTRSIRARARLDYFSNLVSQQLYNQNLYEATRNRRLLEGGLTAVFGPVSSSLLYQRQEIFLNDTDEETRVQLYGSTPRATVSVAPMQLFRAPIYASMNSEYAFMPYQTIRNGVVESDMGFGRFDIAPTLRMPLSRLPFLSVNASAAYRTTWYSRSRLGPTVVNEPYLRQYATLRSEIVGPVFTRIFDPKSGFADRLKHVIEPAFTVDFTSQFADFERTPVTNDVYDIVVSGATRTTYGLTNRLFARGRAVDGVQAQTREVLTVGLQQTYYSNPQSGRFDTAYASTYSTLLPVSLSPVALTARVSPSATFDANARLEYDVSRGRGLQTVTLGGTVNHTAFSAGANFSHSGITPDNPTNFLSGTTSVRGLNDRVTTTYNLNWDIERASIVSQSVMFSYLAQCCGLQLEFQKYNFAQTSSFPIGSDTRFNLGFVLAGLGTFSNFFNAFGGQR